MNEKEALKKLKAPWERRPNAEGACLGGVIQIIVTSACDLACTHCTQASNLRGNVEFITPENFRTACASLQGYYGVVGMFGGNPALHPQFEELCGIMRETVPARHRGIWCNHPKGKGKIMAQTFEPICSNLNVHKSQEAYDEFKRDWPASRPFGLQDDSMHSPVHASMIDLGLSEEDRWDAISTCDIGTKWSALIGQLQGGVYAFSCEVMYAQCRIRGINTGVPVIPGWWQLPMSHFAHQYRENCHNCLVPLRGKGVLSRDTTAPELTTPMYADVYRPKGNKSVNVTTSLSDVQPESVELMTDYIGNAQK